MLKDKEFLDSTNKINRDTKKEYSVQDFGEEEFDDDTVNQCESRIGPFLLFELILTKVRGNTIQFSATKHRKVQDHMSVML